MNDDDPTFYFNGIDRETGEYGVPPMTGEALAALIQGERDSRFLRELRLSYQQRDEEHLGTREGVDPKNLGQAGWGAIFADDADPALAEALGPLLDRRREQAGERFRLYAGSEGFRVGRDSKETFLARYGMAPGPADPERVPYYLLIVGSPVKIPFRFQTQLDLQYAVGRIDFAGDLDAYARYADSVVAAETHQVGRRRRVELLSVANEGDAATRLASERLVAPLREHLGTRTDWRLGVSLGERSYKADLARLLGGAETPALLFATGHGIELPNGHRHQLAEQGAILCQDWPGPGRGRVLRDHYFAAGDLPASADLRGLIAFFFACYGGGTPHLDEFSKITGKKRRGVAPFPFVAALPARMLSSPGGGALAAVGHVERAWGCSFMWKGVRSQTAVFESALDRLLDGHPVGSAFEYFNMRYAELSAVLADDLEEIECGGRVDAEELARKWTANNDARGYSVLGDPAVRLMAGGSGAGQIGPSRELQAGLGSALRTSTAELSKTACRSSRMR